MIEGKTGSGFAYTVTDERLDDYALIEALQAWRGGDWLAFYRLPELLLGAEGAEALKEHCRGESGKVSKARVSAEIREILEAEHTVKN